MNHSIDRSSTWLRMMHIVLSLLWADPFHFLYFCIFSIIPSVILVPCFFSPSFCSLCLFSTFIISFVFSNYSLLGTSLPSSPSFTLCHFLSIYHFSSLTLSLSPSIPLTSLSFPLWHFPFIRHSFAHNFPFPLLPFLLHFIIHSLPPSSSPI